MDLVTDPEEQFRRTISENYRLQIEGQKRICTSVQDQIQTKLRNYSLKVNKQEVSKVQIRKNREVIKYKVD